MISIRVEIADYDKKEKKILAIPKSIYSGHVDFAKELGAYYRKIPYTEDLRPLTERYRRRKVAKGFTHKAIIRYRGHLGYLGTSTHVRSKTNWQAASKGRVRRVLLGIGKAGQFIRKSGHYDGESGIHPMDSYGMLKAFEEGMPDRKTKEGKPNPQAPIKHAHYAWLYARANYTTFIRRRLLMAARGVAKA